jgi:dihydrofolate synthase / folylpolyglutamate synthase
MLLHFWHFRHPWRSQVRSYNLTSVIKIRNTMHMTRTLSDWLDYLMGIHRQAIDMGLDRIAEVAKRLQIKKIAPRVITVGGTNGKGSTVAFIESIARAAAWKVGAYTSPHILDYNERVRIEGVDASDAQFIAAFEKIEAARLEANIIPLTYFEFGTLAALLIFAEEKLDLVILEVGLGGRLDATNIIDSDVAVITTVDLDHQDYLGPDRESIGFEKAGIIRAGKPVVFGEKDPPSSALRRAYELGAIAIRGHSDYLIDVLENAWRWREPGYEIELPLPPLAAPAQLDNAAAAIAALRSLSDEIDDKAIMKGIQRVKIPCRLQLIASTPDIVLDVAHNPQAARQLAQWLQTNPKPTYALFSALADKDIDSVLEIMKPHIARWYIAGIVDAGPRNLDAQQLQQRMLSHIEQTKIRSFPSIAEALHAAIADTPTSQRVLVFGSFHTVAAALRAARNSQASA